MNEKERVKTMILIKKKWKEVLIDKFLWSHICFSGFHAMT